MGILREREQHLKDLIASYGRVLLAFSGGLDSALLACLAGEVLGERCILATAVSPIHHRWERVRAGWLAERFGLRHIWVKTDELSDERFVRNRRDRCFHCKDRMLASLHQLAIRNDTKIICDGSNVDDLKQYRPGFRALRKWKVESPFLVCNIGKKEIRKISKRLGLPHWDAPGQSCLATRIPYGVRIEPEILRRIESAEEYLRSGGWETVRVRHHGELARIEIDPKGFIQAIRSRKDIYRNLRQAGYRFVTLDLAGYQTGCFD